MMTERHGLQGASTGEQPIHSSQATESLVGAYGGAVAGGQALNEKRPRLKPSAMNYGTVESKQAIKEGTYKQGSSIGLDWVVATCFNKKSLRDLDRDNSVYLVVNNEDMRGFAVSSKTLANFFFEPREVSIFKITEFLHTGDYGSMETYFGRMPEDGECEDIGILGIRANTVRIALGSTVRDIEFELQTFPKGYSLSAVKLEPVTDFNMDDKMFMAQIAGGVELILGLSEADRQVILTEMVKSIEGFNRYNDFIISNDVDALLTRMEIDDQPLRSKEYGVTLSFYNFIREVIGNRGQALTEQNALTPYLEGEQLDLKKVERNLHYVLIRGKTFRELPNQKIAIDLESTPPELDWKNPTDLEIPSPKFSTKTKKVTAFELAFTSIPHLAPLALTHLLNAYNHLPDEYDSYQASTLKALFDFKLIADKDVKSALISKDIRDSINTLASLVNLHVIDFNLPALPLTESEQSESVKGTNLVEQPTAKISADIWK